jgi:ribosomal protein S18 acetylase RimI-like enzyme
MGTLSEVRGQGYGAALVRSGCAYVALERGTYLWCDARESAVGFYEKLGFVIRGNHFDLPVTGPHYRMWREISVSDAAYIPF